MKLVPVKSSMIYAVAYDAASHTLDLVYYRTGVYRYFDVPPQVYRDLLKASSIGSYVRDMVIDCFEWKELRGPEEP